MYCFPTKVHLVFLDSIEDPCLNQLLHCAFMPSPFSHVRLLVTPWTAACQATLSMGFSRQESWSGLPCPLAGDLPNPGVKPASLMSPAMAGRLFTTSTTWEAQLSCMHQQFVLFHWRYNPFYCWRIFELFLVWGYYKYNCYEHSC